MDVTRGSACVHVCVWMASVRSGVVSGAEVASRCSPQDPDCECLWVFPRGFFSSLRRLGSRLCSGLCAAEAAGGGGVGG